MSTIEQRKLPEGAFRWEDKFGKVGAPEWKRNEDVKDAWRNLLDQGWETVTFINLMPFKISENFGQLGYVHIPDCPFGQAYAKEILDQPRMDMRELGGAKWAPNPILPVQFAKELERKYRELQSPPCAVFWYLGTGEPPKEQLIEAIEIRDKWLLAKYRQGQASWTRSHNLLAIDGNMKAAARYLHSNNLLEELPEWVTVTKQEQLTHKQECDQCGELNTKIAKICRFCEFPLNLQWVSENRPDLVAKYPSKFQPKAEVTLSQIAGKSKIKFEAE